MIIFNGIKASDVGVVFDSFPKFNLGTDDLREIRIPGTDESLWIDKGSKINTTGLVSGHIIEDHYNDFLDVFDGQGKLEFEEQADRYYSAVFRNITIQQLITNNKLMYFTAEVNMSAFAQLKSGDIPIVGTSSVIVNNPTKYKSLPIIKITGKGRLELLQSGDKVLDIADVSGTVTIDSRMDFIYLGTNQAWDHKAVGTAPILNEGVTTLSVNGDVSKIEVMPRWRTR